MPAFIREDGVHLIDDYLQNSSVKVQNEILKLLDSLFNKAKRNELCARNGNMRNEMTNFFRTPNSSNSRKRLINALPRFKTQINSIRLNYSQEMWKELVRSVDSTEELDECSAILFDSEETEDLVGLDSEWLPVSSGQSIAIFQISLIDRVYVIDVPWFLRNRKYS